MFVHRGYLGWITDLISVPRPYDAWPSIAIDQALLDDYAATFAMMRQIGLNEMSVWGLFVAREWPLDVAASINGERTQQVRWLLDEAHRQGVRVLSGLGVYSWGFEAIIRANPHLSRGNPRALCASLAESWEWQRRVIDYVLSFELDGISVQSADQGRCPCADCAQWGDVEYHARLNNRVAAYVKERWPERLVGVNNWGMDFADPADLPHLQTMTANADYLIDTHDSVRRRDPSLRRTLAAALRCAFGTVGVPNVEPPAHWERDRWFLPTLRRTAEQLQALYADGGRAVENYMHTVANPGDEASLRLAAAVERAPAAPWQPLLDEALDACFAPRRDSARTRLAELFLRAEDAYFDNAHGYAPTDVVRLEPLVSDHAGPPIYLSEHMQADGLARYERELHELARLAASLTNDVGRPERVATVRRCIARTLDDIASVGAGRAGETTL
jgi:hypothetical protein